jgi:acyl-CoA dehydrogenase
MSTEEVVVMMEGIGVSGGGFSAAQAVHGAIYNSVPLVKYGSTELNSELLPEVADGETSIQAFGLTEPNAGSDSTSIEVFAERDGEEFIVNGQKIWTSRVDVSDYRVLMVRTTHKKNVDKRTQGMTMLLIALEDAYQEDGLEVEQIDKTASNFVHSYELFFEDLRVPAENVIGEVGEGFYQMLDGLNEERLVIAAECIGLGEAAVEAGAQYASEREVFGQPIDAKQAIQHSLAESYAHFPAAKQLVYSSASAVASEENAKAVGARANMSKYLAAEAAFQAADAAVQTHGGFGVPREYDVERYFREARLTRLVPITQQLALNYIG